MRYKVPRFSKISSARKSADLGGIVEVHQITFRLPDLRERINAERRLVQTANHLKYHRSFLGSTECLRATIGWIVDNHDLDKYVMAREAEGGRGCFRRMKIIRVQGRAYGGGAQAMVSAVRWR